MNLVRATELVLEDQRATWAARHTDTEILFSVYATMNVDDLGGMTTSLTDAYITVFDALDEVTAGLGYHTREALDAFITDLLATID